MSSDDAVQLAQQAILMSLMIGAPILVVGTIIGLIIGLAAAADPSAGSDGCVCAEDRRDGCCAVFGTAMDDAEAGGVFRSADCRNTEVDLGRVEPFLVLNWGEVGNVLATCDFLSSVFDLSARTDADWIFADGDARGL
ncbi:MAG: flagellar biosynthetic protein FliQ [Pirellulales bacterium]